MQVLIIIYIILFIVSVILGVIGYTKHNATLQCIQSLISLAAGIVVGIFYSNNGGSSPSTGYYIYKINGVYVSGVKNFTEAFTVSIVAAAITNGIGMAIAAIILRCRNKPKTKSKSKVFSPIGKFGKIVCVFCFAMIVLGIIVTVSGSANFPGAGILLSAIWCIPGRILLRKWIRSKKCNSEETPDK